MAIINTLRNKLGKVVVIAIAVSILSFVLADVLGPNSILLGGNNTTVGEIAGQEIDYEDYNQRLEIFRARYGNLGANQNAFIQNQAWDALISEIAFQPEFEALGLNVTEDELVDMVQGRHIDPALQQQFTDPQTGEFSVDNIVNYLKQLSQLPPEQRAMWESYERDIRQGRLRVKYDNLLGLSSYITSTEAKQYYQEQTEVAEIKYLYVPFYSVNDSSVQVTETALQSYLNNHEDEYQTEATKTIQYVNFQIQPSATDSSNFHENFNELKEEFIKRTDDSTFARINSDASGLQFYNTYSIGQLPSLLQINAETLNEGEVYGPYYEAGRYKLYKISKEFEDTVYTAKVRHILIKWKDTSDEAKAEAKQKAEDLLRQLRRGADFAELARENSEDAANAQRGGELGWGVEGSTWVPEFEEAVFERESAGLVNRVVETSFGYHLVDVTEPKTNKSLKIATIEQEITPSQETVDQVYRQADQFAYNSGNRDEFSANASEANLAIQTAENIDQNARNINNIQSAREVVRWMFNEASIGEVSSVFDLDNSYIVALLTGESEKGKSSLDNVRDEITIKVRNELKAEKIKEKLSGLSGNLEEIATAYGSDASVNSNSDLKMSTSSLPSVGFAPTVVGTAFGLNEGQVSKPIAADNGIVVVQLINKTGAPEIGDYTSYKTQMQSARQSRISYQVMEAIKEFADIEDNRIKYY